MSEDAVFDPLIGELLDRWLSYTVRQTDIPGLQVAVRRKGELVFSKAYGHADLVEKTPYTTRHMGRLASQSKMAASLVTLRLIEDGSLSFDQKLGTVLPWVKRHADRRFRDITVRDLLTHRSGLCGNGKDGSCWELFAPYPSPQDLTQELKQTNLIYEPNTYTKYSNYGYGLLGLFLQQATGLSYEQLVARALPGTLRAPTLTPDYTAKTTPLATGYSLNLYDGHRKPFRHVSANALAPAAGLCGTAEAASLFVHRLYCTDDLLSPAMRKDLLTLKWGIKNSSDESYGLGTIFVPFKDTSFIGHSGSFPGFYSQTRHLAGTDYVFSIVVNSSEPIAFTILKSMATLIRTIKQNIPVEAIKSIRLSPPLMNWWGGSLYLVTQQKALYFPLSGWTFGDSVVLTRRKDGTYASEAMGGFSSVGEPVKFKAVKGEIVEAKFAAFTAIPYADFLKKSSISFGDTNTKESGRS